MVTVFLLVATLWIQPCTSKGRGAVAINCFRASCFGGVIASVWCGIDSLDEPVSWSAYLIRLAVLAATAGGASLLRVRAAGGGSAVNRDYGRRALSSCMKVGALFCLWWRPLW